jgi:mitochondrial fission protein ELM1
VGPKAGDAAQLRAVADALARRRPVVVEERTLAFHGAELPVSLLALLGIPSRAGLRAGARGALAPPWPDLILTAGRRNEPVAHWIRRTSGGRARLVHLGRPWQPPARHDLVVTTPQYFLDAGSGPVVTLPLPPSAPPRRVEPPAPALALLVGGDSGAQVLDAAAARAIASAARTLARRRGLALRVATSPRTPAAAADALSAAFAADGDVEVHRFGAPGENPYGRWLADSAAFVVTADSISMVTEAAATGRPLWLAPVPAPARPWWLTVRGWGWKPLTHRLAQRLAPRRFRRDTGRLLTALVADGRAAWLSEGDTARFAPGAIRDGADEAAARIDALLGIPEDD